MSPWDNNMVLIFLMVSAWNNFVKGKKFLQMDH